MDLKTYIKSEIRNTLLESVNEDRVNDFFYMDLTKHMWNRRKDYSNKIKKLNGLEKTEYLEDLYIKVNGIEGKSSAKDIKGHGIDLYKRLVNDKIIREGVEDDDEFSRHTSVDLDDIDEKMSIAARKKMARKSKSKLKRGMKKRLRKMKKKRSNEDLQKAAIRKAKTILMQKMMKKAPANMSMQDKMKFSDKLAKKPGKIQKIAKKILPKLKQAEAERVKKMKARNTQKKFENVAPNHDGKSAPYGSGYDEIQEIQGVFEGTRCWKGYERKGFKKHPFSGKRVPNCVKAESVEEIKESVMSNIHLMIDISKDFEDFKKKFKKAYRKVYKPTPDFMDFLYGMYKDAAPDKVEEDVSADALKDIPTKSEGMVKPKRGHNYYQLTKDTPIKYISGYSGIGLEVPGVLLHNEYNTFKGKKGAYIIDYFGRHFYVDIKNKFASDIANPRSGEQNKDLMKNVNPVGMAPQMSDWKKYLKESVNEEQLDEKLITFSNRAPYGQVVFMAGGAGSGKGFAIDNFIDGAGFRVRDVDEMKKLLGKLDAVKNYDMKKWYKKFGKNLSTKPPKNNPKAMPARQHFEEFVLGKNMTISDLSKDLKNPTNVASLHYIVDAMGLKDKWLIAMLSGKDNKETLPNLLFDITAKKVSSITDVLKPLMATGYDSKNVHLIWVLTKYIVAVERNAKRDRVVPDDTLLKTHEGAGKTMWEMLTGAIPKGLNGRVDVILNNQENTIYHIQPSVRKGKKVGVVSDYLSLPIKKQGGGIIPEKAWKTKLYTWIRDNAPQTLDLDQELNKAIVQKDETTTDYMI